MDGKEIFEQNFEINELLMCATRAFNEGACGYKKYAQPLVLGHFSDIHGDDVELERMIKVKKYLGSRVDDFICTGDLVPGRYYDSLNYWNAVDGSDEILIAIGNHDVLADKVTFDFSKRVSQHEQYDSYFAGKEEKQGIVLEQGKTYYYKDYPKNEIRLIVINNMLENEELEEQINWFDETVSEAKEKNLTILCASHYLPSDFVRVDCNFNSIDRHGKSSNFDDRFFEIIDSFTENGGNFVCWIAGHVHGDCFGYAENHPKQYAIAIDALSRWQSDYYTDMPRVDGTIFQDVLNFTVVDTTSNLLHIIRMGANRDRYLRSKKYMTFDYKNGKIICQG